MTSVSNGTMCKEFFSWLYYANNNNNNNNITYYQTNSENKNANVCNSSSSNNNVGNHLTNGTYAQFGTLVLHHLICANCQKLSKQVCDSNIHTNNSNNKNCNSTSDKQPDLFICVREAKDTARFININDMRTNIYPMAFTMKTAATATTKLTSKTAAQMAATTKRHKKSNATSSGSWSQEPLAATYNRDMLLDNSSNSNNNNNDNINTSYHTRGGIDVTTTTTAGSSRVTYFTPAIANVLLAPTTAKTAAALQTATTTVTTTATRSASAAVAAVAATPAVAAVTPLVQDLLPTLLTRNGTYMEHAMAGGGNGSGSSGGGAGAVSSTDSANANAKDENADNLNSFYFYETEQFAVLWILFTVIVLGNSAVLFVMFINKNRKSRMNYFIRQLALADLSVGLLNVLTDIIWRITISWRAGNIACKIIRFSQVCVTYSSTYVLVAMSIDRYDAITHPMNFSKSWKRARHLVVGAWLISAIFSLPILLLYEEKLIQGQTQCWIELGSPFAWQLYMSLVAMTLFAIPALIISACYAIIVKTIWSKGSMFIPAERAGLNIPPARRASSRGIIPRAKVKTVKMTFVIVIVFIVCWSPYIIFDLLQVFGQIPSTQTNVAIATFIQSLAPLNSAANPLIYCLFSSQVFRTLSRFRPFKWFTCCCKSYRSNSTQTRCNTVGRRLHNSCDSMRTLTTSLTVSSRRSNKPTARVVICERPKCVAAMSEV